MAHQNPERLAAIPRQALQHDKGAVHGDGVATYQQIVLKGRLHRVRRESCGVVPEPVEASYRTVVPHCVGRPVDIPTRCQQ